MNKIYINVPVKITNYELIKELNETYSNYADDIYVILDGNNKYVSLSLCYKTLAKINEIAEYIKSLDLSQMEQIMVVYDFLKERMYKKEDKETDYLKSRDLSEVLFGNYIVCVGYTRLFNAILSVLGMDCYEIAMLHKEDNKGHLRSLIYIDDEKYDIEGYYYFDVTRDSKKDDSNIYKYRYNFFAKTFEEMNILDCDKYQSKVDLLSTLSKESNKIDKDKYIKVLKTKIEKDSLNRKFDSFEQDLAITLSNWR